MNTRLWKSVAAFVAVAMLSARAWRPKFVRMSSTLVGRSGHVYVRDSILQTHPSFFRWHVQEERSKPCTEQRAPFSLSGSDPLAEKWSVLA